MNRFFNVILATVLALTPAMAGAVAQVSDAKVFTAASPFPSYVSNNHAEKNVNGWTAYDDGASATIVDGTGGSPGITWTRTTSSPLRDSASFLFTHDAADRQGEGVCASVTPDIADNGKNFEIMYDFAVASGTYASTANATDLVWQVYNTTAAAIVPVANQYIQDGVRNVVSFLSTASSSAQTYRVCIHGAKTTATAFTAKFDNVQVRPATFVSTFQPMSDWVSFTATGAWTTNVSYTGQWRRVGSNMEIMVRVVSTNGSAPTGSGANFSFNLPTGYVIDSAKIQDASNGGFNPFGTGGVLDNGTAYYVGIPTWKDTTSFYVQIVNASATNATFTSSVNWGSNQPITYATGDAVVAHVSVPIVGWTSQNGVRADQTNYDWTAFAPTTVGSQGFGTIAAESCFHKRDGKNLLINCKITAGTTAASEARITLPNSLTISSTDVPSIRFAGTWVRSNSSATAVKRGVVLMTGGNAYLNFSRDDYNGTQDPLAAQNGSAVFATSDVISFTAEVPITGWTESQNMPILVGSVASNTAGSERIERIYITNAGTPTISSQSGSWVSSLTDNSTGNTTINIASGIFSATPSCSCLVTNNNGRACTRTGTWTATSVRFLTMNSSTSSASDDDIDVICMGPR